MKKSFLPALVLMIGELAQAEPLVIGYERFHSETPSAVGGAILFSELGCANCHGGSKVVIPRKRPFPRESFQPHESRLGGEVSSKSRSRSQGIYDAPHDSRPCRDGDR
jgi:hypothetical protein